MLYKVALKQTKEDGDNVQSVKSELMLRDLLKVLPSLKKYNLEGDISTKIKKLRNGRRQRHYTLEVSRKFVSYDETGKVLHDLKVSAPITKIVNKAELLKTLKEKIITQIKEARKKQLPPYEIYHFSEGVEVKKLAEVYCEFDTFLKLQDRRIRKNMAHAKKPKDNDKYVGIEIEFASKEDRETLCDKLFEAGVGRFLHVKSDSSIKVDPAFPNPIEINILARESEYERVVETVCDVLNKKCSIRVDKSCGLHVHLDMRNRNANESFANLVVMQNILYAMIPANRKNKDLCRYSFPVESPLMGATPGHYAGISSDAYAKYKTLELRMHCGTTQERKINGWIALLISIVNAANIQESFESIQKAQAVLKISNGLVTYIESRISKFQKQHKKIDGPRWLAKVADVGDLIDDTQNEQSEVA